MRVGPVLTRRQRKLLFTAGVGAAFVALAGVVAWRMLGRSATYQPGGAVEGLTADLARALPADHPRVTFTDITVAAGITTPNLPGTRSSQLPEDMGSGAAFGDFDDDGWEDLAIANEVGPLTMTDAERRASPARVMLYRNNHDGTFADVTNQAGIDVRGWAMAVAWGDYDNDGRPDLIVTTYGHNVLYHNDGGGKFSDRSAASGLGAADGFWMGASWGDYDRDGFLDLYVSGYVKYSKEPIAGAPGIIEVENPASINPASFPADRHLLYHNNRNGTFTERGVAAGVENTKGRGLSSSWVDLDGDGWLDLYVGNDVSDNVLYLNRRDGTFEDVSHAAHVADYRSSMGIAVGDWNGDGRQDLYLTHWLAQGNALYNNMALPAKRPPKSPRVAFVDESDRYGLGQVSLDFIGWGTSFFDYDLDGKLDLFVVNGSTLQKREKPTELVPMRSNLFWNRGPTEGFFEVSQASGDFFSKQWVGRGLAVADIDNDGDLDAIVTVHGGPPHLLRNDGGNANHWLQVQLRGTKGNRQGMGATITVVVGGVRQVRQVGVQASYLSQNSLIETFGLGPDVRTVDTLEVVWLGGARDVRTNVAAGQRLRVVEGEVGVATDRASVEKFWALMREATTQRIDGSYAAALATYQRALALDPRHGDALYYLGSTHLALGEYAAAAAWRRLIAVDAHSARAQSQMGALFLCLDPGAPLNPDSADAYFRRAHEINKEETGPVLRLGESALVRGDLAKARQFFGTVLATHAGSAPAHFYLGYLSLKGGDEAAAAREFAQAQAMPVAAAVAGATNEGDTKGGVPMRNRLLHCDALRELAEARAPGDARTAMREPYRRLDALLATARTRRR